MTKHKLGLIGALLIAGVATASSIKVWYAGETLTTTDLNANFAHIHATMVGGHGPKLIDADVASNAAISHAKLATPTLVLKQWGRVLVSGATCSITGLGAPSGSSASCAYGSAGVYTLTIPSTGSTSGAAAIVTSNSTTADVLCHGALTSTTTLAVYCVGGTIAATGAATDANFSYMIATL